jgi:hypothetical protein
VTRPEQAPRGRAPTAAEARAEVEARRDEVRAERAARFAATWGDEVPGLPTVVVAWGSTVALTAVTVAAAIDPDAFITPFFVVAMASFFGGSALFVWVLLIAADRSRRDVMGIGGLFFLAGAAPPMIQWRLLGALGVAVTVSVAGAAVRPFTPLAFGTLAPVLQLALCGWWAVRHGLFPAREVAAPVTGGGRRGR